MLLSATTYARSVATDTRDRRSPMQLPPIIRGLSFQATVDTWCRPGSRTVAWERVRAVGQFALGGGGVDLSNPLSQVIAKTGRMLTDLNWDPAHLLASLITMVPILIVLVVSLLLWPYGLIFPLLGVMNKLLKEGYDQIRDAEGFGEQIPRGVALAVYAAIWLPIAVLAIPLLVLGLM